MAQSNAKLEVIIVSVSDVRDYAENQLPKDQHEVIEDTLLDDDRARRVVHEHAEPLESQPVAEDLSAELRKALKVCQECVVNYELLSRASAPETVVRFGASRFTERWKLLAEMLRAIETSRVGAPMVATLDGQDGDDLAMENIVNAASERDFELAEVLHEAFEVTQTPAWKAQIAEWISNIRSDIGQISWLKSAFITPQRA